ncbi:hypothetical protein ATO6_22305 [Oceanicola sp. 22II-s10i]|nr:hypothetical protein ATO6_22305 [Oceanicola sp. 22II-s10i]
MIYGEQSYATSTSHDMIQLYMNFFNMADARGAKAVEDINVMGNVLNGASVNGNALDNEMRGNVGNDTLSGGSGNDEIFGKGGNDKLSGGIGNDFLSGDAGNDFIDGGNDQDTIYGGSGNDSLWGASGNDVIYGGSEDDVLKGEDGNDYLDGGSGFDRMDGGAGNDTLKGGEDMAGGEGNDTFYVVDDAQIVTEALNEGQDVVRTTLTEYTLGANLEELVYEGDVSATVSFEGNASDNYISARNSAHAILWGGDGWDDLHGSNTGYDQLYGGSGDDVIYGYGGDDFINGGTGHDYMRGGTGNDTYVVDSNLDRIIEYANEGYDIARITNQYFKLLDTSMVEELQATTNNGHMIAGNMYANTIRGLNGEDVLQGFDGNDYLVGNGGNDSLDGGSGNDTMLGGYGNDTYWIDSQYDKIVEYSSGGFDTAYIKNSYYSFIGSENVERMIASSNWNTTIHGTNGHNRILGGAKNDLLSGRGGNDNIHGGGGADRVYGGTGNDQFIFQNNRSNTGSKVMDFVHGEDKIVLDSDGQWGWAAMGNGTVVIQSGNGGGSITVYADNLYYGSDIQLMSDSTIANLI